MIQEEKPLKMINTPKSVRMIWKREILIIGENGKKNICLLCVLLGNIKNN